MSLGEKLVLTWIFTLIIEAWPKKVYLKFLWRESHLNSELSARSSQVKFVKFVFNSLAWFWVYQFAWCFLVRATQIYLNNNISSSFTSKNNDTRNHSKNDLQRLQACERSKHFDHRVNLSEELKFTLSKFKTLCLLISVLPQIFW